MCSSSGFVAKSLADAAHVASEAFSRCGSSSVTRPLVSRLISALDSTQGDCQVSLPLALTRIKSPLHECASCTVSPAGAGLWTVQFGNGVYPSYLLDVVSAPAVIRKVRMDFILKPIPETGGAKAFSALRLDQILKDSLGESACFVQQPERGAVIRVTFPGGHVDISSSVFTASAAIHHADDLVIFPNPGVPVPSQLRDSLSLMVTVSPIEMPLAFDEVKARYGEVMRLVKQVSNITTTHFGCDSPVRLRSLATKA